MISQRTRLYLNTFFALALFIILPFSRLAYYSIEASMILLGLFIIVGAIWIGSLLKFPISYLSSPLNIGWVALIAAIAISSTFSINPAQSWRLTWSWTTAILAFFIVLSFLRMGLFTIKYVFQSILAVSSFFLLAGYAELGQIVFSWASNSRFMSLSVGFINGFTESRNILVLFIAWIILICIGFIGRKSNRKVLWIILLIAATPLFLIIQSAGGYVALAGGIFIVALGKSSGRFLDWWNNLSAKQARWILILSVTVLLMGGIAFAIWLTFDAGFSSRTILWGIALESFRENPLNGSGMGTYISAFLQSPEFPLRQFPLFYAHSLWFNILADSGLVGVAAVTIWLMQFSRFLFKHRAAVLSSSQSLTLLSCLTTFVIYASVETPRPRLFLIAAIFLACLIFDNEPEAESVSTNVRWALSFWPVLYILLGVGIWQSYRVAQQYELGVEQAESGNWAEAAKFFDQANSLSLLPDTAVLTAAAYSHAQLGYSDPNAAEAEIAFLNQLIAQESSWPINHLHLALIHQTNGDLDLAETAFKRAANLAPDTAYIHLNQALFYATQGDTVQAQTVDSKLYLLTETWHQAPYWQNKSLPTFEPTCDDITCFYFENETTKQAWELLAVGQINEARQLFEAGQPNDPSDRDFAVYLGLFLAESNAMNDVTVDQMQAAAAQQTYFFDPFVAELFILETVDEAYLNISLEHILAHSAHSFGRNNNGDYIRLGYLRSAMPDDLLPAVQCFTADDHLAWQLTQLENWYQTNERLDLAKMVQDALLGPNGNGVRPCINGQAIRN